MLLVLSSFVSPFTVLLPPEQRSAPGQCSFRTCPHSSTHTTLLLPISAHSRSLPASTDGAGVAPVFLEAPCYAQLSLFLKMQLLPGGTRSKEAAARLAIGMRDGGLTAEPPHVVFPCVPQVRPGAAGAEQEVSRTGCKDHNRNVTAAFQRSRAGRACNVSKIQGQMYKFTISNTSLKSKQTQLHSLPFS